MKVVSIKSTVYKTIFKTVNSEARIDTLSYSGPEMTLEDGSALLYASMSAYFDVITNPNLYKMGINEKTIKIEELISRYLVDEDEVIPTRYRNKTVVSLETYSNGMIRIYFEG